MYRIAISDDDRDFLQLAADRVWRYCKEQGIGVALSCFSDSELLMEQIESGKLFDAYLLDIRMKRYSGMDIAQRIRECSDLPLILFLTAYPDYAIEACRMDVFWYLCKERLEEEGEQALGEMFARLGRLDNKTIYVINNARRYLQFFHREIIYIYKKQKNVVFVLTGKRTAEERNTLQEVYRRLNSSDMVYLDRGVILNLSHVRWIKGEQIGLEEGHIIISNTKQISGIKEKLSEHWKDSL